MDLNSCECKNLAGCVKNEHDGAAETEEEKKGRHRKINEQDRARREAKKTLATNMEGERSGKKKRERFERFSRNVSSYYCMCGGGGGFAAVCTRFICPANVTQTFTIIISGIVANHLG